MLLPKGVAAAYLPILLIVFINRGLHVDVRVDLDALFDSVAICRSFHKRGLVTASSKTLSSLPYTDIKTAIEISTFL